MEPEKLPNSHQSPPPLLDYTHAACRQNGRRLTKTQSDSAPNLSIYEQGLAKTTPVHRERIKKPCVVF